MFFIASPHCTERNGPRERQVPRWGMIFKVGDNVGWNSHGGEASGTVVRVAHEDGEVSGFTYRAS